jgi:hypothetical protein
MRQYKEVFIATRRREFRSHIQLQQPQLYEDPFMIASSVRVPAGLGTLGHPPGSLWQPPDISDGHLPGGLSRQEGYLQLGFDQSSFV